jgi:leucine dehydrogenase
MFVFDHKEFDEHERIGFFHDAETGLKAIIAIHNTNCGPALGGCRMWDYASEEEAVTDVLRLSRGMSYKAAITGLPLGGGKSVIIGDARKIKTPEMMRAMGRAVQQMGGDYIIAEDVSTSVEDMEKFAKETSFVVGLPAKQGSGSGDPSPLTAYGVFAGLKSAVKTRLDRTDLKGLTVAVQGLGQVGYNLCRHLHEEGAKLIVTDINTETIDKAVKEFGAVSVGLDEIYDVDADVYAPCALGATLNDDTLARLKVSVIAGAANNQLAESRHGDVIKDMNVLYAPDYVINAGGLINVWHEYQARTQGKAYDIDAVKKHIGEIAGTTGMIFKYAAQNDISTAAAADSIAEERFKADEVVEEQVA